MCQKQKNHFVSCHQSENSARHLHSIVLAILFLKFTQNFDLKLANTFSDKSPYFCQGPFSDQQMFFFSTNCLKMTKNHSGQSDRNF